MAKNVIILEKGGVQEVWGALTDICDAHGEIKFATVREKKYPFTYKGFIFSKIPYKAKLI